MVRSLPKVTGASMTTTTMNISLSEALKRYVRERAKEGKYSNPSDFVRTLIREDQRRQAAEALERDLFADFIRTRPDATPAAWETLRTEFRQRLASLRQEIDEGLAGLDRAEGVELDSALATEIKRRGRRALKARSAGS